MFVRVDKAIDLLKKGEIVAIPTETVYGLAGDATSKEACSKIFDLKQRPAINPLIIHVTSLENALEIGDFSEEALKLAESFWPGPLTIVVPKKSTEICSLATANLNTIAIRVPANEITRQILSGLGSPIAAPSANPSSRLSPTKAEHVKKSFLGLVPIVDGGQTIYGIESTIIDCTGDVPTILRHGFITKEIISSIFGYSIEVSSTIHKIKAPGMLSKHYSPLCNLRINAESALENEIAVNYHDSTLHGAKSFNLSSKGDLIEAASNLFNILQISEELVKLENLTGIAIAPIPNSGIGLAINDKLSRACTE